MTAPKIDPRIERARGLREQAAQIRQAAEYTDVYHIWYRERLRAAELDAEAMRLEREAAG